MIVRVLQSLQQVQYPGPGQSLRTTVYLKFRVNIIDMFLDGTHSNHQFAGNFLVGFFRGISMQNLVFAPA